MRSYEGANGDVAEDDHDGDDHGDRDAVRGHVGLYPDLLVNQAPLVLLPQRPRGNLRLQSLAAEPAATASGGAKKISKTTSSLNCIFGLVFQQEVVTCCKCRVSLRRGRRQSS